MSRRILCTALSAEEGPHFEILRAAGLDPVVVDRSLDLWDPAILSEQIAGVPAIIAGSEPYPRAVLERATELRLLARMGVGFDAIDVDACDDLGIRVTTTPGVNHDSVAEHAIAMIMALARGFPRQDQGVRQGRWVREAQPRVQGSTLGLVGLGRIGQATAWRAAGLGMRVLAYEPHPNQEFCDKWKITCVPLDDLLAQADYVSLHCPATRETCPLMTTARFAQMKQGSVFINTARGPLVDEPSLIAALQDGHLRAAGLDVFAQEPLPLSSPLIAMDNVLLAGHTAGLDCESHHDTYAMGAETIVRSMRDEPIPAEQIQNKRPLPDWSWTAPRVVS